MANIRLDIKCKICKQWKSIMVDPIGYQQWKGGMLIQKALPDVDVNDRELMISGICGTCYDDLFADPDDDEDYKSSAEMRARDFHDQCGDR